ncbi:hypothetical protein BKA62DRAFT_290 [Auriculariales sp. MPI-PUGE-AT-0066]|nr:hypothetical protein BKA62DRAFT_290 [Auriculariales sp. MPI-PUGE-AT-0066]
MLFTAKAFIALSMLSSVLGHAIVTTTRETAEEVTKDQAVQPENFDTCPDTKALTGPPALVQPDGTIKLFARHWRENTTDGRDGSTYFNARFSYSGWTGSFSNALEIPQNGDRIPLAADGIDEITVRLPNDAKTCITATCTIIMMSQGRWGNCLRVVSDGITSGSNESDDTVLPEPTDGRAPDPHQPSSGLGAIPTTSEPAGPAATEAGSDGDYPAEPVTTTEPAAPTTTVTTSQTISTTATVTVSETVTVTATATVTTSQTAVITSTVVSSETSAPAPSSTATSDSSGDILPVLPQSSSSESEVILPIVAKVNADGQCTCQVQTATTQPSVRRRVHARDFFSMFKFGKDTDLPARK